MLRFNQDSHHAKRALQAYLILIGLAADRKTIRYGQLAERMHYGERVARCSPSHSAASSIGVRRAGSPG